jgi:O-antigen/teichoic acid export membrane protein
MRLYLLVARFLNTVYLNIQPFWRNVITVMAGTMLSQGIPMAVLLVLTRIVPAAEIGSFSLLLSAANVFSILVVASLDKAIFSARTEEEISELLRLTIVAGFAIGLIIIATILIVQKFSVSSIHPIIAQYSICVVMYSLLMAFSRHSQAILTYRSQFLLLNKLKLLIATPAALAQLTASLLGLGVSGLIYSTTFLSAVSMLISWNLLSISWQQFSSDFSTATIKKTFLNNYRFTLFSLPAEIVSAATSQLPIFIIAVRFGAVPVAMYALVLRVLSIPVGLLGSSVLTVFQNRAGQEYRDRGNCISIYLKTLKILALLSFLPFLGLHFFGSNIVNFLLGEQWNLAGEYAEILAPMLFIAFVSSPLSYVLFFSKRGQQINLLCQLILSLIVMIAFGCTIDMSSAISYYSILGSIYYVFYMVVSYHIASGAYSSQPV